MTDFGVPQQPQRRSWRDADAAPSGEQPVRQSFMGAQRAPGGAGIDLPGGSPQAAHTSDGSWPTAGQPTEVFAAVPEAPSPGEPYGESAPYGAEYATAGGPPEGPPESAALTPWWRQWWAIAAAAVVVLALVITGIALSVGGDGQPTASPSPSVTTSTSPSPTVSAPPPTLLDDGIADTEYPAQAAGIGDGYPEALTMEPWVWDRIGPGWAVTSYVARDLNYRSTGPTGVYLASPEGKLFLLGSLPMSAGTAEVVSWLEADHKARITLSGDEYTTTGAMLNLDTMAIEQMSFTVAGAPSRDERPLAADSSNNEMWFGIDEDWMQTKIMLWSPAGGWRDAGLGTDVSAWGHAVAPDGSVVVFEYVAKTWSGYGGPNSGSEGRPNLVVVDVATGAKQTIKPSYGAVPDYCFVTAVTASREPVLRCENWSGEGSASPSFFSVSGSGQLSPLSADALPVLAASQTVAESTDPVTGLRLTYATETDAAAKVETAEATPRVLVEVGAGLSYDGVLSPRLVRAGEGLALLSGVNACVIIDLTNGGASVLAAGSAQTVVGCAGYEAPRIGY